MTKRCFLGSLCLLTAFTSSLLSEGATITSVFPSGGAPGHTIDIEILGGQLQGTQKIYVNGEGIRAEIERLPDLNTYIKNWHVIGPFPNKDDKGFDVEYPPEKQVFNPGQTFAGSDNQQLAWKPYKVTDTNVVYLHEIYPGDDLVAYAFGYLESPTRKKNARFIVRGDDGVKVWFNGKLCLTSHKHLPMSQHRTKFRADVKRGKNSVLIKIDQGIGEWEFDFVQTDEKVYPGRKIARQKCSQCHGLRTPSNRLMTPGQWESTVLRMIRDKDAPINANEARQIIAYFKSEALKSGVSAKIHIDKNALAGPREIRLATRDGISTAWRFEVGAHRELLEIEPNSTESPQRIKLPVTVNGMVGTVRDIDCFQFQAKKDQRIVINIHAYRMNEKSQIVFNPWLSLLGPDDEEVDRNIGHYGFDPLIDYTIEKGGKHTVVLRDLLYRGNQACVYRMHIGELPYDTYIFPAGGTAGSTISAQIGGQNVSNASWQFTVPSHWQPGRHELGTPFGVFNFEVGASKNLNEEELSSNQTGTSREITLPFSINGRISEPGQVDHYRIKVTQEAAAIQPFWVIWPFPNKDDKGLDVVYPPEFEIDFKKTYQGKKDRPIKWYNSKRWGSKELFTNVPEEKSIGYALTWLNSPRARDAFFLIGSSDGVKIWLNDELVWVNHVHRPIRGANDIVPVRLNKGKNKILAKVENAEGQWGLILQIDGYFFEAVTKPFDSPHKPFLTLRNKKGRIISTGRDGKLRYSFSWKGVYDIEVSDIAGSGGDAFVYRLNAKPLASDFGLRVSPDNPNIGRGCTLPLLVTVTHRVGVRTPIELEVKGLPDGVTASKTVLPVDQNRGVITLTATDDAPYSSRRIEVVGTVRMGDSVITRTALPLEIFRIQNRRTELPRKGMACSVVRPGPFQLTIQNDPEDLVFTKKRRKVTLRVRAQRSSGYRRQIPLRLAALPPGINGPPITFIKASQQRATIKLTASGADAGGRGRGDLFVGRTKGTGTYQIAVLGQLTRDVYLSSPVITVRVGADGTGNGKGRTAVKDGRSAMIEEGEIMGEKRKTSDERAANRD